MPRIEIPSLNELSADGLNLLQSAGNIEVEVRTGLKGEDLRKALLECDGAICRSGVKITAEALQGQPAVAGDRPGRRRRGQHRRRRPPPGKASW